MFASSWTRPLVVLACFLACNFAVADNPVSFTVLELPIPKAFMSSNMDLNKPWNRVFNSSQDWADFYNAHYAGLFPVDSPFRSVPVIDFGKYTLIMGGLGGGTARELVIDRVVELDTSMHVGYFNLHPDSGCVVAQIITFPTRAVLVPKTSKPIRFSGRYSAYRCDP